MQADVILVVGIVLAVFAVPSIISALSDGRAQRVAAVVLVASGALVIYAIQQMPDPFTLEEIPNAFIRVVARAIH